MRADLHTHTYFSDGTQSPKELAENAKKTGVKLLSITDHDNMDGNDEKKKAVEEAGLYYVAGMEISAYENTKVHITGYGLDPQKQAYLDFMDRRRTGSYLRAEEVIYKLNQNGILVTIEDVEESHPVKTSPLHTMHIARAVAKKGYYPDEFTVYAECLRQGKFAYSSLKRPDPFEAVEVIRCSGGIASLAHPGRIEMNASDFNALLKRLVDFGINGIEAVYTTHTERETKEFLGLAERYSLLVTGGSDVHKENVGGRRVGYPFFEPSKQLLQALKIEE